MKYEDLLEHVLEVGEEHSDRTGTGTYSTFGGRIEYDLREGFPLITSKKVFWKGVVEELLWMLRGEQNIKSLQDKGVHIWDEWADEDGNLGPVYGVQWRHWEAAAIRFTEPGSDDRARLVYIDQIASVLQSLKEDPLSRRHIVTAWNPGEIKAMELPPCHMMFQFYVSEDDRGDRRLSIQVYQRSADMFLGVPFNLASYALLNHMVAWHLGYGVGKLIWIGGDVHIYKNHEHQVEQQLRNHAEDPRPLPTLTLRADKFDDIFSNEGDPLFTFDDLILHGYDPHPAIKAPVAI